MTENFLRSLSFLLFCRIIFTFGNIFFFDLNIKFGKTKQKVITLVATTFKTSLAIPKTSGRFSRRKFNTANVYDLFLNVLIHIFLPTAYKKGAQPKSAHRKTQTPIVVTQTNRNRNISAIPKLEGLVFLPRP